MIRRPPRSTRTDTLFPYTTLFRSHVRRGLGPSRNRRADRYRVDASRPTRPPLSGPWRQGRLRRAAPSRLAVTAPVSPAENLGSVEPWDLRRARDQHAADGDQQGSGGAGDAYAFVQTEGAREHRQNEADHDEGIGQRQRGTAEEI